MRGRVIICGGGAVGASTAYFLSCRGISVVVIDRTGLACAASGKSGGFLALDWCDGTPLQSLARRSFELHARLAEELGGGAWGYRRLDTYGAVIAPEGAGGSSRFRQWLSDSVRLDRQLGSAETTAQVDPAQFTAAMMRGAEVNGSEFRSACMAGLLRDGAVVRGVRLQSGCLEGDAVVIALGPWSGVASGELPLPPVFGLKGHSILFATGARIGPEALFAEYEDRAGSAHPEVFPRPSGTTYVCAISSTSPLPLNPANVAPDPGAIERLETICARISPVLAESRILARQACYRPVTLDGLPLIGPIPGLRNAYVATGHSVWGMLNAPATGEALAELIVDGAARSIDLAPFRLGRPAASGPASPGTASS